jgi:glucokinase
LDLIENIAAENEISWDDTALAVAAPGPYFGNTFAALDVSGWEFCVEDLRDRFTDKLIVVHDVAAGAAAVETSQSRPRRISEGSPRSALTVSASPRTFIQTGVGLGVSALLPTPDGRWQPFSGEGGSAAIAAISDEEVAVLDHFRRQTERLNGAFKWGFPSAQALLSLNNLHHYSAPLGGSFEGADSRAIVDLARDGDEAATAALRVFAGFLGTFAGDVALMFRSYGGVSIAGLLPPQLIQEECDVLLKRLRKRGSAEPQLQLIPVFLIEDQFHSLVGLASLMAARLRGQ